jgi:hypothetical protein
VPRFCHTGKIRVKARVNFMPQSEYDEGSGKGMGVMLVASLQIVAGTAGNTDLV